MMMQSQHFSHAMSRQQNPQAITGEEDTYTGISMWVWNTAKGHTLFHSLNLLYCAYISDPDSIVLRGVAKAHLDCSVQIARNMKGSKSTQESEADEDTDHPWISKKVCMVMGTNNYF